VSRDWRNGKGVNRALSFELHTIVALPIERVPMVRVVETRSDLVSHASRDGLSVKIHPDTIGMHQSDHADSRAIPCQQECS
jgi:hypothetical protein